MKHTHANLSLALVMGTVLLAGCGGSEQAQGISPERMADALHAVMEADRTVYTQKVVNRLQNEQDVIQATEHWKDENTLPLPAQMFRMGAEETAKHTDEFTYSLQSLWPINKQNAPRTEAEKKGLKYVVENPAKSYYAEEELGGKTYFTAVYADQAVAPACVECHNNHKDTPRDDFELGDVMGGVVIRIPQS